ncbi:MAG TPA: protein-glutamate O-methyltransferase CheR [Gemmatimonadales bacterium]|nr:protein-glutamate O-methyltransferase CheR [Gemmatimonadales bacterium]
MAADDAAFETLTREISRVVGVPLDIYKAKCLRRRIAVRMRACGVHTFDEYLGVLGRTPAEYERLKDALTINVTRFYRNSETWDSLRSRFLPDLLRERDGWLDVWSAGCSSGEEPYTVAMLVAELAAASGRASWLDRLRIEATDIDRESLALASAAVYRREAFQETPPDMVARHTREIPAGLAIVPALRRRVHVRRFDLSQERMAAGSFDLIICRNVVIYFDRPMQERLFAHFADSLRPGGLLVLGKVETLLGPARDRLTLVDTRERIYRAGA